MLVALTHQAHDHITVEKVETGVIRVRINGDVEDLGTAACLRIV